MITEAGLRMEDERSDFKEASINTRHDSGRSDGDHVVDATKPTAPWDVDDVVADHRLKVETRLPDDVRSSAHHEVMDDALALSPARAKLIAEENLAEHSPRWVSTHRIVLLDTKLDEVCDAGAQLLLGDGHASEPARPFLGAI